MATPDAEDVSLSPEYSGDLDDDMAAEQKTDDGSPSQKTANGRKPASNAKDPLRPRRKKARRACFACQRAHLTCGEYSRPIVYKIVQLSSQTCHHPLLFSSDQDRRRATMRTLHQTQPR